MLGRNSLWAVGAVIAGLLLPSQAMAQYVAHTRADLNLRVGPGTQYGIIDVIPAGYPVEVYGCLESYAWCDIYWDGLRGWVSARYLVQPGTTVYLPQYAPRIGVPIISFSFGTYHDRYYRDRPWYRERHGRWSGRDWRDDDRDRDRRRGDRDRDRAEPREERREVERPRQQRQERREVERPRQQQRDVERPRQRQREAERPRQQEREAERQQEREAERQQEREAQPRKGERTQRQGQRRQRPSSDGSEELQLERGQ